MAKLHGYALRLIGASYAPALVAEPMRMMAHILILRSCARKVLLSTRVLLLES